MMVDLEDGTVQLREEKTWHGEPSGVVIDKTNGNIFWLDAGRNTISRSCLATPCYKEVKEYKLSGNLTLQGSVLSISI